MKLAFHSFLLVMGPALFSCLFLVKIAFLHIMPQASIISLFSNKHIFLHLLHMQSHQNKLNTHPLIASIPSPEKGSETYIIAAELDFLEQKHSRLYFIIPCVQSLFKYSFIFPNIVIEDEMMVRINRKLDSYTLETTKSDLLQQAALHKNSSKIQDHPIYPAINILFYCYRSLQGTYMTLDYLKIRYHNLVEVINIGPSYLKATGSSGHDILALKLTNKNSTSNFTKPPLFVICGIHSRELSTPEACTRFAENMLDQYGKDPDKTWILNYTEIHMVIQANPDGREDEEIQLGLQNYFYYRRKNMNSCSTCLSSVCFRDDGSKYGVDLNRNFPHSKWGTVGVSGPCYSSYPGVGPASEPETQAIVNYFESVFPPGSNIVNTTSFAYKKDSRGVLIDVHSYGETFFWPYAFSASVQSPNEEDLRILAEKFASVTSPRHRVDNELYLTSGDTTDWAHETLGLASYTFEIGTEFYEECSYFEKTVTHNANRVLLYAARIANSPYSLPQGPEVESITLASSVLTVSEDLMINIQLRSHMNEINIQIESVSFFIDEHPYDEESTAREVLLLKESKKQVGGEISIPLSEVVIGKHILYVQANGNGIKGPVYSKFFDIIQESG